MKDSISVSVALATYNGEAFLREQLVSLLSQTYRVKEIVICDDASTDGTWDILEEYKASNQQLFSIHRNPERIGYIRNFEQAITRCSGCYIALSDQDDIWYPHKIERLLSALGSFDLVHSDARLIDAQGYCLAPSYVRYSRKAVRSVSFQRLLHKNTVTGCTLLMKSDFAKQALPFPICISHDWWLALLAADRGTLVYCDEALTQYRQHDGNILGAKDTQTKSKNKGESFVEIQDRKNRKLQQRYAELAKAAEGHLLKCHLRTIQRLARYYGSYFTSNCRISDFLYHFTHFIPFSGGMSIRRALKHLGLSTMGRNVWLFWKVKT